MYAKNVLVEKYFNQIQALINDLHKDYQDALVDNYNLYVEDKYKSGVCGEEMVNGMAPPEDISEKWHLYAQLNRIKGQKKLIGARALIRKARNLNLIPTKYYYSRLMFHILRMIVYPIGITIFYAIIVFLSPPVKIFLAITYKKAFLWLTLLIPWFVLLSFGFKFKHPFYSDLIDYTVAGIDLRDFDK